MPLSGNVPGPRIGYELYQPTFHIILPQSASKVKRLFFDLGLVLSGNHSYIPTGAARTTAV